MKKLISVLDINDLCGTAGAILLLYGVAQWSRPAAWILSGLGLLAIGIRPMLRRDKS
jgi:ABC-type uncharacterized transport system permease subunit